jgi:hypothetical protein
VPQIIVTADRARDQESDGVMLRERVNVDDFESERFAANLIERLGWAVVDATEAERTRRAVESRRTHPAESRRAHPADSKPTRRTEPVHA